MNKEFLGKPNKSIEDWIKQLNKLVIYLTNGKYVTFSKEELGSSLCNNFRLDGTGWKSNINVEPMQSKILEAAGTTAKTCVSKVIDKHGLLKKIGLCAFQGCTNLQYVYLPELLNISYFGFYGCSSMKLISLPKAKNGYEQAFYACSQLECAMLDKIDKIEGCTLFFGNCSNLHTILLRNVKTIAVHNSDIFLNCTSLKNLSFPKCESIVPYASSGSYFSFNAVNLEELDMPILSIILTNDPIFRTEVSCKKAVLGLIPLATIQAKSAWGLPVGCEVIGKDGSYVI